MEEMEEEPIPARAVQETRYETVMRRMPSDAERAKLRALPCRVGLYVSHADLSGGEAAEETELQRLKEILRAYAEDYCKSEFVQTLLSQCIAARAQWGAWASGLDSVPEECVTALYDLRGILTDKEVAAFQYIALDIAQSVATAFHEDKPTPAPPSLWQRLFQGKTSSARLAHSHISPAEREALNTLADALDMPV